MKTSWKGIGEGAIGGAIVGVALLTVGIIGNAAIEGATPGEWLNFAAVIVGVVLTIGGARLIEWWAIRRRHQRAASQVIAELDDWLQTIREEKLGKAAKQHALIVLLCSEFSGAEHKARRAAHDFAHDVPPMFVAIQSAVRETAREEILRKLSAEGAMLADVLSNRGGYG